MGVFINEEKYFAFSFYYIFSFQRCLIEFVPIDKIVHNDTTDKNFGNHETYIKQFFKHGS